MRLPADLDSMSNYKAINLSESVSAKLLTSPDINCPSPGARPTNDISIEFEIRSELGAL